jgi:lipoprotein-anchoring transpeptidase ErfK/SrfK
MPSRRSRALAPVVTGLVVIAAAAPAAAQEPQPPATPPPAAPPPAPPTIKPGLTAGGVDLSGLTVEQATQKLDLELRPRVEAPLVLTTGGRGWTLPAARAKVALDSERTARRALYARTAPGAVTPVLGHDRRAVDRFVRWVARRVFRAPRDARVRVSLRRVALRRSRPGRALATTAVRRRIDGAFRDGAAPRALRHPLTTLRPRLTTRAARRQYRTVITIDKSAFRLRLFKGFRVAKRYPVAVGQPAYPTPSGRFSIANKQVDPVWSVPNSPWAGELQGTTVAGGSAGNPLKARWMGIVNGVGIHGTDQSWSIGTRASHGCIRMHVPDVIDLFRRVPVGTPVLIA